MNANDSKIHGCKCRNCGIEFITQSKSADTYCRFCGAPALTAANYDNISMPELVLPFEVNKAQAGRIFSRHLAGRPLSPSALLQKVKSGFICEVYIPVRIGDIEINTEINAIDNCDNKIIKRVVSEATGTDTCQSNMIDRLLYGLIGEYDFSRAVAYDEAFSKIPFEKPAESLQTLPTDDLETESVKVAMDSLGDRENIKKVISCKRTETKQNCKTVLVPVWILSNLSNGYSNQIFINGQNGRIVGEPPVSAKKALAIFGGIAAGCTVVGELIWMAVNAL